MHPKQVELLKNFIVESVIDASGTFKQKRQDDFSKKITGVVNDLPDAFQRQEEQERKINSGLEAIKAIASKHISIKRLRLAIPGAFGDDGWSSTTDVFTIFSHMYSGDQYHEQLIDFIRSNREKFEKAIAEMDDALHELTSLADSMHWPAPWRRYTRWNEVASRMRDFKKNIKDALK